MPQFTLRFFQSHLPHTLVNMAHTDEAQTHKVAYKHVTLDYNRLSASMLVLSLLLINL